MKIAIAILNWNGEKLLRTFLPPLIQYSPQRVDIYVIDNGSTDGSREFLRSQENVKTILLEGNFGFSKGYNLGLAKITADVFVLLNSDVEVTEGWLDPMIEVLNRDPNVGICQPKIKDYTHRDQFEYAGAAGGFIDKDGYPFCRGRIFNVIEKDEGQYDESIEISWASGACMMIRSDLFIAAGRFDEDFFAHMEEIDLCWRVKNLGAKIKCIPASVVYHMGGATLGSLKPKKTYYNFRNNLFLLLKNFKQGSIFLKIVKRLFMDGLAGIKFLIEGSPGHSFAVFKAHLSFYFSSFKMNRKRKVLMNKNSVSQDALYQKSIVWKYFIQGKKKFSDLNSEDFGQKAT